MKEVSISKEGEKQIELLALRQEIFECRQKLRELLNQDEKESGIIKELNRAKEELIQAEKDLTNYQQKEVDLTKAAEIKYSIIPVLKSKIDRLESEAGENTFKRYFVNEEDIAATVAKKCNLSVGKILVDEQQKLLLLPAILQQRIKGQVQALREVTNAIFRARAGIQDPNRPFASFLFVGPTGVGKTEVALTIAEQLFDQSEKLVHLNMTEFSEPHSISKLIGSPPGYIGYEDKPLLEIVREKMNSVLLFDEVEKCHPEVLNILLKILDNGSVTLANGQVVNFRNTIIVLTTNLGSELYFSEGSQEELKENLEFRLKDYFRPEFLNRLDKIVFFNPLNREVVREIIIKELELFVRRVAREKNIKLEYREEMVEKIFHQAYSREYGARPIKHYIEREIGTLVARGIISQLLQPGGRFLLDIEKDTEEIKITTLSLLGQKKNYLE